MKLTQILVCLIVSVLVTHSESLKVIFARNTTAQAEREAEAAQKEASKHDPHPDMSTIINVQTNCKPGFVYESTFHNRCRKVAG